MALHAVDMVIVIIYLVAVVGIGVAATRRLDNNRQSIREYFLAGRQMSWLPVGASLFVSNIGKDGPSYIDSWKTPVCKILRQVNR